MLRKLLCTLFAVTIVTGIVLAEDAKGKFKKYDKRTLTLTVGDKDTDFTLTKETKVLNGDEEVKGKDRRTLLQDLKEGTEVSVSYDKVDDKLSLKEVKVKK